MNRIDRRTWLPLTTGIVAGLVVWAPAAGAHTDRDSGALASGVMHPLLGIDHLFAMVTVGIVAALISTRPSQALRVPAAFLAAMATGGALGMAGVGLPGGEMAIALSVVALGAAVVAGAALRPGMALGLVALAGVVHGHAHGLEAPSAAHPAIYALGFLAATAVLHLGGVGVGIGLRGRAALQSGLGTLVMGTGVAMVVGVV